jgi:hypothetical protein
MKKSLMITAAICLAAGSCYFASADDDFEERYYGMERQAPKTPQPALFKKECGSCHMAYQPGLLPQRSWKKMTTTLEDHFGTDASLEPEDRISITAYLTANAADIRPAERHMAKIASSVSPDAPMRMTRSRYFVREHREIPMRYISQPEVKSLANCNACHQNAGSGEYRERGIFIPNYGRWDD